MRIYEEENLDVVKWLPLQKAVIRDVTSSIVQQEKQHNITRVENRDQQPSSSSARVGHSWHVLPHQKSSNVDNSVEHGEHHQQKDFSGRFPYNTRDSFSVLYPPKNTDPNNGPSSTNTIANNSIRCTNCEMLRSREKRLRQRLVMAENFIVTMNRNLEIDTVAISNIINKRTQMMGQLEENNLHLHQQKHQCQLELVDVEQRLHDKSIEAKRLEAENRQLKDLLNRMVTAKNIGRSAEVTTPLVSSGISPENFHTKNKFLAKNIPTVATNSVLDPKYLHKSHNVVNTDNIQPLQVEPQNGNYPTPTTEMQHNLRAKQTNTKAPVNSGEEIYTEQCKDNNSRVISLQMKDLEVQENSLHKYQEELFEDIPLSSSTPKKVAQKNTHVLGQKVISGNNQLGNIQGRSEIISNNIQSSNKKFHYQDNECLASSTTTKQDSLYKATSTGLSDKPSSTSRKSELFEAKEQGIGKLISESSTARLVPAVSKRSENKGHLYRPLVDQSDSSSIPTYNYGKYMVGESDGFNNKKKQKNNNDHHESLKNVKTIGADEDEADDGEDCPQSDHCYIMRLKDQAKGVRHQLLHIQNLLGDLKE